MSQLNDFLNDLTGVVTDYYRHQTSQTVLLKSLTGLNSQKLKLELDKLLEHMKPYKSYQERKELYHYLVRIITESKQVIEHETLISEEKLSKLQTNLSSLVLTLHKLFHLDKTKTLTIAEGIKFKGLQYNSYFWNEPSQCQTARLLIPVLSRYKLYYNTQDYITREKNINTGISRLIDTHMTPFLQQKQLDTLQEKIEILTKEKHAAEEKSHQLEKQYSHINQPVSETSKPDFIQPRAYTSAHDEENDNLHRSDEEFSLFKFGFGYGF